MIRYSLVFTSALALAVGACMDSGAPTTSRSLASRVDGNAAPTLSAQSDADDHGDARVVRMRDACDPASFDAALHDPNACVGNGHVTFDRFVAELMKTQRAAQWRFDPSEVELDGRKDLLAVNRGGEVHTFTRVAKFGGGIVPFLNNLSGNTTVAPECTKLEGDDFVAPGATYTAELSPDQLQHFQCCIHPWMRADVRLKHDHDDHGGH
jgi:hypothetical protein